MTAACFSMTVSSLGAWERADSLPVPGRLGTAGGGDAAVPTSANLLSLSSYRNCFVDCSDCSTTGTALVAALSRRYADAEGSNTGDTLRSGRTLAVSSKTLVDGVMVTLSMLPYTQGRVKTTGKQQGAHKNTPTRTTEEHASTAVLGTSARQCTVVHCQPHAEYRSGCRHQRYGVQSIHCAPAT